MPSIGFILGKPQVTFDGSEYGVGGWRLCYDAELANSYHQHVEITTEEGDLQNLKGTIGFEPKSSPAYMGFEKGSLTYWKGDDDDIDPLPSSYLVTIRMNDDDLARVNDVIASGIPLLSVNISLAYDGMELVPAPDGSKKKWDTAAKPALEITGYRLSFGKPEEEEVVPDPPEPAVETDVKILTALRDMKQTFRYILFALFVLITAVILR